MKAIIVLFTDDRGSVVVESGESVRFIEMEIDTRNYLSWKSIEGIIRMAGLSVKHVSYKLLGYEISSWSEYSNDEYVTTETKCIITGVVHSSQYISPMYSTMTISEFENNAIKDRDFERLSYLTKAYHKVSIEGFNYGCCECIESIK